eukprot:g6850.t1
MELEAGMLGGENSADHLILYNQQECYLPQPFGSNGYSTDSSSTQLTGGIGSTQNYAHSSYALLNGGHRSYRPELLPMEPETMGYLDDSSGLYPQSQLAPFLDSPMPHGGAGFMPPFTAPGFNCSVYSAETNGSSSGGSALTKDSMFVSNIGQETGGNNSGGSGGGGGMDLAASWEHMTSSQLETDANKLTFADLTQSMLGLPTCPTSGAFPSLQEQPMYMEPQALRCNTGLIEPTLTTTSNWWNAAGNASIKEENRSSKKERELQESPGSVCNGAKARWKPNTKQLCFLEQHFRTGYTKSTPELFRAVKEVGSATESQVSVWLKNRLARCKRHSDREMELPRSDESSIFEADYHNHCSTISGNKRERQETDLSDDFASVQSVILDEITGILQSVDGRDIKGLARAIRDANNICCYGVSREGLVMKGFALNLFHLGFKSHCVGDTTTPALTRGDLLLVAAGPSYYSTVSALGLEAMRSGARVIAFTAHKTAPLPFAESVIRIASQTLPPCMPVMNRKLGGVASEVVSSLPDGRLSCMQMGGSFEAALSLVLDSVCVMLRKKLTIPITDMTQRRTNLS